MLNYPHIYIPSTAL